MLDALTTSLSGMRVGNIPVGEGTLLAINTLLGKIGYLFGKRVCYKLRVPSLPAKVFAGGAVTVALPTLIGAMKIGGPNAQDRLAIATINVAIDDLLNVNSVIDRILTALPFLGAAEEEEELSGTESYTELPVEEQEETATEIPIEETSNQKIEGLPELESTQLLAGLPTEEEINTELRHIANLIPQ